MTAAIRLHDRTPLTSEHFSIRDTFRRITAGDLRGIALAWEACSKAPPHSIILVKHGGIIAWALGWENTSLACTCLEKQLVHAFRREARFNKRIVAVLNYFPNWSEANEIAATGADALFIPIMASKADIEQALVEFWLGTPREQFNPRDKNGMQERALIIPRYTALTQKRGS